MERMRAAGKIRRWGVSNLDVDDLEELGAALADCATDQVLYSLEHRGIEHRPAALLRAQRGMPVMAYSPVGQGGALLRNRRWREVAKRHGATPAQVAIAWTLRAPGGVISIPKASDPDACAAEREGAGDRAGARRTWRRWTPPSRRRSASARWRCCSAASHVFVISPPASGARPAP